MLNLLASNIVGKYKSMHIATVVNKRKEKTYVSKFLRHSFRDEQGRVQKKTLACLSDLPDNITDIMSAMLKGKLVVEVDRHLEITDSEIYGPSQAFFTAWTRLDMRSLLGRGRHHSKEKRIIGAVIGARILFPDSKLATTRLWKNTSLPRLMGLDFPITEDDIYRAMDWLITQQDRIEEKLSRALFDSKEALALYDLTSTYFEVEKCVIARRGYNRDQKKNKLQINIGLLCNAQGCPVAVSVHEGNVSDSTTLLDEVKRLQERTKLSCVCVVGDRGMITGKQIKELRQMPGVSWISALKSQSIQSLFQKGDLLPFTSDQHAFVELSSDLFPGERLIACYNPDLASKRTKTRRVLIRETFMLLVKLRSDYRKGLIEKEKVSFRLGEVLNSYKMKKHFRWSMNKKTGRFSFKRNRLKILSEESLDGIYVIRTADTQQMSARECIERYKSLALVERAFRHLKTSRLMIRPVYHYKEDRVRSHVLLCMLAYFVEWHMKQAWNDLIFAESLEESEDEENDDSFSIRVNPVEPREPSVEAKRKAQTKKILDGSEVHSFSTLLESLNNIVYTQCRFKGVAGVDVGGENEKEKFTLTSRPSREQKRALNLLKNIPARSFS